MRTRQLGPGDKLGKYEVIRQIAIGGMAELYLARTHGIEGFEKLVVIKRILPQYVDNASFVNMFLNEARIAATLHHPNVAQVYDIGLDEGDYFFAMEYVHGEDLDHMSRASEEQGVPISMDAALTLAAGLCAGLHYAHDKISAEGKPLQIVHRDVSPSNVLVSYDGAVKLVDFGIARVSSHPGTTQGGLKGKIAYMSPEQCTAKATLDRRSDIYSVGALLYELTTGRLPFQGETEYQILSQIVNEDVPAPSSHVPSYPPQLEKILLKALTRDPDKRYATALELQGAIEDFAHETRLRISALTLGRLMGTLFPSRLEDWDHAKKQGAFFVEQHVVKTLIESGKATEQTDEEKRAILAAIEAHKAAESAGVEADDEATQVSHKLVDLSADTNIGPPPMSADSEATIDEVRPARASSPVAGRATSTPPRASPTPRAPTPTPPRASTPAPSRAPTPTPPSATSAADAPPVRMPAATPVRATSSPAIESTRAPSSPALDPDATVSQRPTPIPGQPQAYPLIHAAQAGTMISSQSGQPPQVGRASQPHLQGAVTDMVQPLTDVTERVHVPRQHRASSPTTFIRTTPAARKPIVIIGGLAVVGVVIATIIVMSGGKKIEPTAAPRPMDETVVRPTITTSPTVEQPGAEQPKVGQPNVEQPTSDQANADQSTGQPKAEQPKVEQPKVATPKVATQPKVAAQPKIEQPMVDTKAVTPKTTSAKTETKTGTAKTVSASTTSKSTTKTDAKATTIAKPKTDPKKWNNDSIFMPVRTNK